MRLSRDEIAAIKTAAAEAFGDTAVVRLFGSRVNDSLRGGDIDLLIEADPVDNELDRKEWFMDSPWRMTEPRKVDVLVAIRGQAPGPFECIAYRDGIVL